MQFDFGYPVRGVGDDREWHIGIDTWSSRFSEELKAWISDHKVPVTKLGPEDEKPGHVGWWVPAAVAAGFLNP